MYVPGQGLKARTWSKICWLVRDQSIAPSVFFSRGALVDLVVSCGWPMGLDRSQRASMSIA